MKTCPQCLTDFEVTQSDLAFYDKVSPVFNGVKYQIPEPTFCPDCLQQQMLSFRNERKLYHRKCDLTGRQIISIYSTDKPFPVYDQHEWWSDKWDGCDYGKDFDFSRPFFDQFFELEKIVPHIAIINIDAENSDYCNLAMGNKNCYLIFGGDYNQDCYYGELGMDNKNVLDADYSNKNELSYMLQDSVNCYNCQYVLCSKNCKDCYFIDDCNACSDCILCTNLKQKSYCIWNIQYSKEEYFQKKNQILKSTDSSYKENFKRFQELRQKSIRRHTSIISSENCNGDHIYNSKNCHYAFDVADSQDLQNVIFSVESHDCRNACLIGKNTEWCYQTLGTLNSYACRFGFVIVNVSFVDYSQYLFNSKNCFGCFGLKNKEYCILNKQYTKEEYEALVPKIIEHMQKTGEWGKYSPTVFSPFGYNETAANDYFPFIKTQVLAKGWKWKDEAAETQSYLGPKIEIPDDIKEIDESICKQILICEISGKPYKIIPQEFAFYKKMNIPLPRECPDQRYKNRLSWRNPRKLWTRNCMKCGKSMQTTYAPERPEIVYCEECYLKAMY